MKSCTKKRISINFLFTERFLFCIIHTFFNRWEYVVLNTGKNEPFDVALRRFKRSCEKAGILADVRAREFYEKPTTVRKRAKASAIKRHAKKMARENARHTRLY